MDNVIKRKRSLQKTLPRSKSSVVVASFEPASVDSTDNHNPPEIKVTSVTWPAALMQLERVFSALNTVCTFCSTRKHVATTFEAIKASVENITHRELTANDLAAIKYICPTLVDVSYVDNITLNIHLDKANDPFMEQPTSKPVLLFEFCDGHLGKRKKNSNVLGGHHASTPIPKLTKMIEKRNLKFREAIEKFINFCNANNFDPETHLIDASKSLIPIHPISCSESEPVSPVATSIERSNSVKDLLLELQTEPFYEGQLSANCMRTFAKKLVVYGELEYDISQELRQAIKKHRGIERLYSHQAEAINNLHKGHHVIVSTSTASGKSLIYQIPVIQSLLNEPNARAMYIFPTKALAQDQKRSLEEMLQLCPSLTEIKIATFDGDTPLGERENVRVNASVIFTNPDMLHCTLLPNADRWKHFIKALKFVVVDELHAYNGLFGSHVAFIMRRLIRICKSYGNNSVQFVSCSATIGNPDEHMKKTFGISDVKLTSIDGAPCGQKEFVLWNPPLVDKMDSKRGRKSSLVETALLFEFLIARGVRTIVFCKYRRACEILLKEVQTNLRAGKNANLLSKVMSYRAGYTPQDRRRIEQQMFHGELLGIIATSALELGVDIGSLDAVIMMGIPWSISAMWQQSGRAGRRNNDSLSILVAESQSRDQNYMNNPEGLFSKPHDCVNMDITDDLVLESHLQCAADEIPIQLEADRTYFGDGIDEVCRQYLLYDDQNHMYLCHPKFRPKPSRHVSIRNIDEESIAIVDVTGGKKKLIEEIEASRAVFTIYEGGIYLHQGVTYLVDEINMSQKWAKVRITGVDWYTRQRDYTDVDPMKTLRTHRINQTGPLAYYGDIRAVTNVFGYFKVDKNGRLIDIVDIQSPPIERNTVGFWIDCPASALAAMEANLIDPEAAVHAAAHILISLLPSYTLSVMSDVRTECKSPHATRPRPARIILYDSHGPASGLCFKAFQFMDDLIQKAYDFVSLCPCLEGCLDCINILTCLEDNKRCSKAGAYFIIAALLEKDLDIVTAAIASSSKSGQQIQNAVNIEPNLQLTEEELYEIMLMD